MKNRFALSTVGLLSTILFAGTAQADDIIFNSLGPGDTYNCCSGSAVTSFGDRNDEVFMAATFTPSITATFGELLMPLSTLDGYDDQDGQPFNSIVEVELLSDNGGTPGVFMDDLQFTTFPPIYSSATNNIVQTLVADTSITLTAGTPYWIEILPFSRDTGVFWNYSLTPGSDTAIAGENGYGFIPWARVPFEEAFEVLTPVPEPSPLSVLGVGIALTIGLRRLRAGNPT